MAEGFRAYVDDQGRVPMLSPETLDYEWVPKERAAALREQGWIPETKAEHENRLKAEEFDQPLTAGVAGAARGFTFGLSDLALTGSGLVDSETLANLQRYNPEASAIGDVGGSIASFAAPGGLGGLVAKGAAKAGGLATRGAAQALKTGTGATLPKLAGAVARGGTEGAAIGTGQAVSSQALYEDADAGDAARQIGFGALTGGALGAAGIGATALGERIKQSWSLDIKGIAKLRGQRNAMQAELRALESQGAPKAASEALQREIAFTQSQLAIKQSAAVNALAKRAIAYGVGHALGGGVGGGLVGLVVAPKILSKVKSVLIPLGERGKGAAQQGYKRVQKLVGEELAEGATRTGREFAGRVGQGLQQRAERAFTPEMWHEGLKGSITGATKAVAETATDVGRSMIGGAFRAGEAGALGAQIGTSAALGAAEEIAEDVAMDVLRRRVMPLVAGAKRSAIKSITALDMSALASQVHEIDPAELEIGMRTTAAPQMPAEAVDAGVDRAMRSLQLLQEKAPRRLDQLPSGETMEPSPRELQQFREVVETISEPQRALERFAEGKGTRQGVEVLERVYPEAIQFIRDQMAADLELARAENRKLNREQRDQLALLMGDPSLRSRFDQPQMVATLQQMMFSPPEEQQGPGRPPKRDIDIAQSRQTRLQNLLEGRA